MVAWDTSARRRLHTDRQHEHAGRATLAASRGSNAMIVFAAAIGATIAAIFENTIGFYLRVGDAQPHLVLIFGIIWTFAVGIESGLAWAFIGGIVLDVLAKQPFGTSSFALVACIGIAAAASRLFGRARPLAVAPLVAIESLIYSMTLSVLFRALGAPVPGIDSVATLVPGIVYDTLVAVVVGPLAVAVRDRRADVERVDW
jgi:rod shape-determining protein MreD